MKKDYCTVAQLTEKYPAFSQPSIRALIAKEEENGMTQHIRRVGRRVLISESGFAEWIEEQGR